MARVDETLRKVMVYLRKVGLTEKTFIPKPELIQTLKLNLYGLRPQEHLTDDEYLKVILTRINRLSSGNIGRKKKKQKGRGQKNSRFFSSWEWTTLRYAVLQKFGRKCMCCGAGPKDGVQIQVDHIKPRSVYPELALSIDNLQVLCGPCNKGKGAWDETDFRK